MGFKRKKKHEADGAEPQYLLGWPMSHLTNPTVGFIYIKWVYFSLIYKYKQIQFSIHSNSVCLSVLKGVQSQEYRRASLN